MPAYPVPAQSVVEGHLQAFFRRSVDGVLQDYTDDSVLIVPEGTLRGLGEIRRFFEAVIGTLPPGFLEAFKLQRQEFTGEVGHISWEASPWVRLGTDTFVVTGGKIALQTFAAYPALSSGFAVRGTTGPNVSRAGTAR